MDIFDRLQQDHAALAALADALGERRDDDLVLRLRRELTAHLAAEELVLYQRIADDPRLRPLADDGFNSHKEARGSLSRLFVAQSDDEWAEAARSVREAFDSHVRVEEERLFPQASRSLVTDEGEILTRRYDEALADQAA